MAGDSGSSFPYTAISVVALFLSTTYLGQHAFELWRQADSDASKRLQLSQPPVEARLWEDPLGALNRHRQKFKEPCPADGGPSGAIAIATAQTGEPSNAGQVGMPAATAGPAGEQRAKTLCQMAQPLDADKFKSLFGTGGSVTLIAAMLPGAALVGAEEARQRSRYALLAGLNAAGYVPNDSERMGLLRVDRCEYFGGCIGKTPPVAAPSTGEPTVKQDGKSAQAGGTSTDAPSATPKGGPSTPMDIVYETLSTEGKERRHVALLWIDDTAIGRRWLSAITVMLKDLEPAGSGVQLRILGPTGSDALVRALGDDLTALAEEAKTASGEAFGGNWQTLAKLRLISPQSTAPANQLRPAALLHGSSECSELDSQKQSDKRRVDCVDEAFRDRLGEIVKANPRLKLAGPKEPFFVRTIGTDDLLIKRLMAELYGRGVDPCLGGENRRVVLISEWDSIYARTFSETLRRALQCSDQGIRVKLQTYSYLRGLDGATLDNLTTQVRRGNDNARGADKAPPVEWPEGRAQSDYVRRLVQEILKDNDKYPVQAVGMIGSDVHDKLVLMQALREAFPDRMLFTTDMDARLSHPSVTRYTRNVIVASSLPLVLDEKPDAPVNRIAPFRDAYQTATFLAARLASAVPDEMPDCRIKGKEDELACRIEKAVAHPMLFEIGRDSMVALPAKGVSPTEEDKRRISSMVALAMLLALGGLILAVRPGPAMQHAWKWWSKTPQKHVDSSHVVVAAVEAAALGFAAGVVVEMVLPGSTGPLGPLLLAVTAGLFFRAFVFPGRPWAQALRPGAATADAGAARAHVAWRLALLAASIAVVWCFLVAQGADAEMREPFALLSGVSAWPSELLRVAAIVLFAWFLDEAWCRSADAARRIGKDYRLFQAASPTSRQPKGPMERIRDAALWFWQPAVTLPGRRVDGAKLWNQYRMLMDNEPRFDRVLAWLVVSAVAIGLSSVVVNTLTDNAWADIPARGLADRSLFWITLFFSGLAVIVLLVLVGDMTILTLWFVERLKHGRTVYPPETVARFAAQLGPGLREQACELVAAYPNQRGQLWDSDDAPPCRNSMLDDWIDAQLLAEHTAAIGRLIIFPFILVALLVVARSRLFDNWDIGGAVLVVLVIYVLWSIALAAMLNYGAEQARRKALDGMEADARWLNGAGDNFDKLAKVFPSLIADVRALRKGAFAPFFEQPLVQAILVPLGGAGGVQLLDWLLYARAQ